MNTPHALPPACRKALDRREAGFEDEFLMHAEACPGCAAQLQEESRLRVRLQSAARGQSLPPGFETRLRARFEGARRRVWPLWSRVGMATVALAVAATGVSWLALRAAHDSYIARLSAPLATLFRAGLADHVHCSVFRKYPAKAPALDELAETLAPQYRGLLPAVRRHVPERYRAVLAHECSYRGRRFIHVSLRDGANLLSLVITRKKAGESLAGSALTPALAASGLPLYAAATGRFEIASAESRDHLIYFVSDLPAQQNLSIFASLAEDVRGVLRLLEA